MQQWQITSFGIDNLAFLEKPSLHPGQDQVLIRVHAVSLNYRDLMTIGGKYNPRLAMPRVPCSDGAGEVLSVGPGVTRWAAGDRVAGIFMQNWLEGPPEPAKTKGALGGDIDGMLATEVVLHQDGLVRIPTHLSYHEAATLPCAGVTAWNALFSAATLQPGDAVLIQGTGGVSIFALQFAKLAGARVLGISSSDEKLACADRLGLDAGLNYRTTPEWDKWALEETGRQSGGPGVDVVVEVGGSGTLGRSLKAVRVGGTVAQIGVLSGGADTLDVRAILTRHVRIHGVYVGSRADFIAMNQAIEQAQLKPVIDKVFPFHEAKDAFRHMESGSHFGKIVIDLG